MGDGAISGRVPVVNLGMSMRLGLRPACTAEMAQFAQLVSLPALELEEMVRAAVDANPLLEPTSTSCANCGSMACAGCRPPRRKPPSDRTERTPDVDVPALDEPRGDVIGRARIELPARQASAAAIIVEHCDERGVLTTPLAVVAERFGLRPRDAGAAVDWLRRDVGAGVAADSLVHSLRLQLRTLPAGPDVDLADRLLEEHLGALAAGRLDELSRDLDVPLARIACARELVRDRLELYPSVFPPTCGHAPRPAPPDVIVRVDPVDGALAIDLADDQIGVRLRPDLVRALSSMRTSVLDQQLSAARSLVRRLRRRRTALRAICEVAVEHRASQILGRPELGTTPLTRAAVASAVGVHESTVSRAVSGRILRCPDGSTMALSDLFDRTVGPKALIADLIADEVDPLSDREVSELLAARGFILSRRTVAKYRAELGIPGSAARCRNRLRFEGAQAKPAAETAPSRPQTTTGAVGTRLASR